jgi:hypothetical protein
MNTQTHLFPEPPEGPAAPPPRPAAPANSVAPVWLQRVSLFILVIFCVYLGVVVTVLPWWTAVWDHNLFFTSHPFLWSILRLGPVRGVISGLGLLDIWIGISEAINYRDQRT